MICALLFIVSLVALEAIGRKLGHRAMVVDTPALWSHERERVYERGPRTLVLLGASRMQQDIATDVLRRRLPDWAVVQLSVNGRYPAATLFDLAEDEEFNGIVVMAASGLGLAPERNDDQRSLVEYYHRQWTPSVKVDRRIRTAIETNLVLINPYTRYWRSLIRSLESRPLPKPYYKVLLRDRSRPVYFDEVDPEEKAGKRLRSAVLYYDLTPRLSPEAWLEHARKLEPAVEAIRARGGRVVFIRLPTSGRHWEIDEENYARAEYWDRFAASTRALAIHFRDVPGLNVECPDTSHLGLEESRRFTEALADELQSVGVL